MKKILPVFAETTLATLVCSIFGLVVSMAIQIYYVKSFSWSSLGAQYLLISFVASFVSIFIPLAFFNVLKYYLNQKGAK